jgi:hypothetical protein
MASRTEDEALARWIAAMGEALGTQFHALWKEAVWLHWNWDEHVELFGSKPSRVDLLNEAAPAFFRLIQDALWEVTALHIARLTDPPKSAGRANLTIQNLPALIKDAEAKEAVVALIETAVSEARFCRDWRNRYIAHRDLDVALDRAAAPLGFASRKEVSKALRAIAKVLDYVDRRYTGSATYWKGGRSVGNALCLLQVLDAGLRARRARAERLERGELTEDDYPLDL